MKILGVREKSNKKRGNDNTNEGCRMKNLNPDKSTALQLRSPNLGTQFIKQRSGKLRSTTCLTTLQQPDGTFTFDTESTTKHMLYYVVPEDDERNDTIVQKQIREQIKEPRDTKQDKPFSREEIASVIRRFNPKMTPAVDGLTSEILLRAFRSFTSFLTEVYNKCLKEDCFPKQ